MRSVLMLAVLAALAGACNDDEESLPPNNDGGLTDASVPDASTSSDAGVQPDATTARSLLPRPGALERPPTALPDSLKPPR